MREKPIAKSQSGWQIHIPGQKILFGVFKGIIWTKPNIQTETFTNGLHKVLFENKLLKPPNLFVLRHSYSFAEIRCVWFLYFLPRSIFTSSKFFSPVFVKAFQQEIFSNNFHNQRYICSHISTGITQILFLILFKTKSLSVDGITQFLNPLWNSMSQTNAVYRRKYLICSISRIKLYIEMIFKVYQRIIFFYMIIQSRDYYRPQQNVFFYYMRNEMTSSGWYLHSY